MLFRFTSLCSISMFFLFQREKRGPKTQTCQGAQNVKCRTAAHQLPKEDQRSIYKPFRIQGRDSCKQRTGKYESCAKIMYMHVRIEVYIGYV